MTRHLLVALLGLATAAGAQLPAGYHEGRRIPLPDSLRENHHGSRFRLSVTRTVRDSTERELLARAEALMPHADSIERLASAARRASGFTPAQSRTRPAPGDRWWFDDWDDVWLPYAVTGATVVHYMERVRTLAGGPNPAASWNPGVSHGASMEYSAVVEPPTAWYIVS